VLRMGGDAHSQKMVGPEPYLAQSALAENLEGGVPPFRFALLDHGNLNKV